jgi:hypothetical protein
VEVKSGTIVLWTLVAFTAAMQLMAQQGEGPILHPKATSTNSSGNAQAVCKFISEHMQSELPQSPTLCSAMQEATGDYEINVFSPKDVLERDMRKAWSSALFQTLESLVSEKSLNGACSGKKAACWVNVTDSLMAAENIRYRLLLSEALVVSATNGNNFKDFSDTWYIMWWNSMMNSKEAEHPQSKENAELIAKDACEEYLQTNAAEFGLLHKPPPSCSVLLATDQSIYVELDFSEFVGALVANNLAELPKTFGKAFDATSYGGQVIVKSPWMSTSDGAQSRFYYTFPLYALEFFFEEIHSGSRSEAESHITLVGDFRGEGQTNLTSLFRSDQKGDSLTVRNAAIVHVNFGQDDSVLLQTTDGAEWRTTEQNLIRCGVSPGSEASIFLLPDKPPSFSVDYGGTPCRLDVTFVRGW